MQYIRSKTAESIKATAGSLCRSTALYTIRDGRIFEGNNTWPYDAAYSIEGERIYRGNATFASWFDVLFTVRDGQFYKGDSSFILDIAYTVRDGRVYEGRGDVRKYAIRCAVYDRIRGLLSIGGNPGASNLQTGVLEYTFRLRNTVHLLLRAATVLKPTNPHALASSSVFINKRF